MARLVTGEEVDAEQLLIIIQDNATTEFLRMFLDKCIEVYRSTSRERIIKEQQEIIRKLQERGLGNGANSKESSRDLLSSSEPNEAQAPNGDSTE